MFVFIFCILRNVQWKFAISVYTLVYKPCHEKGKKKEKKKKRKKKEKENSIN